MDFLSKKTVYKDDNLLVTKLTDLLTHDFFYIVKTNIQGDFKRSLTKEISVKEENDALKSINEFVCNKSEIKNVIN